MARDDPQSAIPRARVRPAPPDHAAQSVAHGAACPLLLPAGREALTINQLLADENMKKQNDYVEVRGPKGTDQWVPS